MTLLDLSDPFLRDLIATEAETADIMADLADLQAEIASEPLPVALVDGEHAFSYWQVCDARAFLLNHPDLKDEAGSWHRAIWKAYDILADAGFAITIIGGALTYAADHTYVVTPQRCECKAAKSGRPCKHRAVVLLAARAHQEQVLGV